MGIHEVVFIGSLLTAFISGWVYYWRDQQLKKLSKDFGMKFSEQETIPSPRKLLPPYYLGRYGEADKINNIFQGEGEDTGTWIFDFDYTIKVEKEDDEHSPTQTAVLFHTPSGLPSFIMIPRRGMDNWDLPENQPTILYKEHPGFTSNYHLQGENGKAVRAIFTKELRNFFAKNYSWCVEARPEGMIIFISGFRVSARQIQSHLHTALFIKDQLVKAAQADSLA
ncbi:MAG TPA: hypothetical protein DCR93_36635 [Cytophagales bacterium]|nr:hypothetical protein [Cytophagales bacterium]